MLTSRTGQPHERSGVLGHREAHVTVVSLSVGTNHLVLIHCQHKNFEYFQMSKVHSW
jgi:hypothetical protein